MLPLLLKASALVWMSRTPAVRRPYCAGNAPVIKARLPTMPVSMICPNAPTPSGSMMPLMRYCRLACSLRTCSSPLAAESCDTPGTCSSALSSGVLVPCGSASRACWFISYEPAPVAATMLRRAWSNASFLPATACASVCGGGAAGVSRRRLDTTCVRGRRGCSTGLGAVTSISGSAVAPAAAAGGVCAWTGSPRPQSSSEGRRRPALALRLATLIPIPSSATGFVIDEFGKCWPSMSDGPISAGPGGSAARDAAIRPATLNPSGSGDGGARG